MVEGDTIEEGVLEQFLQKLTACIERDELDACVEEAARLAGELGIDASALLGLSLKMRNANKHEFVYVLALGAVNRLDGHEMAMAYFYAGSAAGSLGNINKARSNYMKFIKVHLNDDIMHYRDTKVFNKLFGEDGVESDNSKVTRVYGLAEAHAVYGYLLIDDGKRDVAISEIESASELFKETGRITQSHLAKAWFYQRYSEKYFNQKEYLKSSDNANKASAEYFKAAETAEGNLIDILKLQGNILKAKYFMRKIPPKPWYNKIHRKLGKKPNISEFVSNLQNAAIWYQKASLCPVDGKKDICTACYLSISTFSEVLSAINAFINGNNAEINKAKWLKSLESAKKTYADKELEKGTALVDSLKQLVKCADKLAEEKAIGLNTRGKRLWKCQDNLTKVNDNLDGVLGIISDHTTEAIRNYAQKKGMIGFVGEVNPKKSIFDNPLVKVAIWVIGIFGTLILSIVANQLFEWRIQDMVFAGIFNM